MSDPLSDFNEVYRLFVHHGADEHKASVFFGEASIRKGVASADLCESTIDRVTSDVRRWLESICAGAPRPVTTSGPPSQGPTGKGAHGVRGEPGNAQGVGGAGSTESRGRSPIGVHETRPRSQSESASSSPFREDGR